MLNSLTLLIKLIVKALSEKDHHFWKFLLIMKKYHLEWYWCLLFLLFL